mgnify:CR=1 FL=1
MCALNRKLSLIFRGISKVRAVGAIATSFFGRIKGAACGGAALHYYLYYYLSSHFLKGTDASDFDNSFS